MQSTCGRTSANCSRRVRSDAPAIRSRQALGCLFGLALASLLVFSAGTARAEAQTLVLRQALALALDQNKELAAFEYQLSEQDGRVLQAGLLPNPEFELEIEDMSGSGRYNEFDLSQTTLSLEWVLEGWIRRRRVGAGEARADLAALDARILQLDVAAETAQRFLTCLANQTRLTAADEAVELAKQSQAAVARRKRAGKTSSADRMRADAELASSNLLRDHVEHELAADYRRLAAQWGEVEPGSFRVQGELLTLPATRSFDELAARLEQNPQLVRWVSEERLAEANLRLAEARRWPTWHPKLGVRRYEATGDYAMVAKLRVDLPLFNRNQGQVSASRSVVARTRADAEAARVRVRTALFELYEELQHHIHGAETLRGEVVPGLAGAMEEVRRGYERGRYSYLEWRLVQAELLEARSELIEASAGAHRLVVELERLTGEQVAVP